MKGPYDFTALTRPLAHPGEHLREDFLPAFGLTPGALAKAMGLKDRTRVERLVRGAQPVTPDTALRLARVFGTTAEFWMTLQAAHDLSKAAIAARGRLEGISRLEPKAAHADRPAVREEPAQAEAMREARSFLRG